MKGFPKTYDRFIQKMLLELKRDPYTFVSIHEKVDQTKNGLLKYERITVVNKNADGTWTPEVFIPGFRNIVLKRSNEPKETRHEELLAIYYARQVQKAFPDTKARINRMIAGCPYIGELKCGWEFTLNGVPMKLLKYDADNKAYLVSLLNQNGKKMCLSAKQFRRVAVELSGYFDTKKIYKVVPKKEIYPIITDMSEFIEATNKNVTGGHNT